MVVLYTDGVSDAKNSEGLPFTTPRLEQAVAAAPAGAVAVGTSVMEAVRRHVGGQPQFDDITLLCFGRE